MKMRKKCAKQNISKCNITIYANKNASRGGSLLLYVVESAKLNTVCSQMSAENHALANVHEMCTRYSL